MSILICYDGSPDAQSAIAAAGSLFSGRTTVVVTVWEGFNEVVSRAAAGMAVASLDFEEIDAANAAAGLERAQEGAALARAAGLDAEPRAIRQNGPLWEAILATADSVDAELIVIGSRGLSGVRSLLLGSVSHAVVQHADRPVIVVPGQRMARRRAEHRRGQAGDVLADAR